MGSLSMNSERPLISIAMATYNGEEFLAQQIDSILNQSWKNIELIICDDHSDDSTVEIIERYVKENKCIKLYKNESRVGVVKNFEKAIGLSSASYIALSDQDDIWVENKLELLMSEMHKLEQSYDHLPLMVHSDLSMIDDVNNTLNNSYFKFKDYNLKKTKDLNHIISRCGVMGNTVLMNSHLKNRIVPFPDGLDIHDYWIALINEIYGKRTTCQEPLVHYRIHTRNLSNSIEKFEINIGKKAKKILTFDFSLPYMGLGRDKLLRPLVIDDEIKKRYSSHRKLFILP